MTAVAIDRLRDGIAAVQAGEYDRARALLRPITEESPDDVLPWYWLALASPSADAAIPCLRRVLAIDSQHGPARAALARLLVTEAVAASSAGRRPDARAFAREAVELAPNAGIAWLTLGSVSNDRTERLEALRRAVELAPRPQTRTRLRHALMNQAVMIAESDRPSARALLREAATLDPADMHVWQALVQMADTPADVVDVADEMARAAREDACSRPLVGKALAAHARALQAAGQMAEATACWRDAISVNGRDLEAWLGLAETTCDDEEKKHAIKTAFEIESGGRVETRPAPAPAATPASPAPMEVPADLAAIEPRADAFARFDPQVDLFALLDSLSDPFAEFEFLADPFARFAPDRCPDPAAAAAGPVTPAATGRRPSIPAPAPAAPSSSSPAASPVAGAGSQVNPVSTPNGARRTVMVVDDSPTVRKVLGLTLERAGYRVVAEPDGESALERLAHVMPDVVLLDTAMPRLDGYAVCSRMRDNPRTARIPVVMLSDEDAVFDAVKGRRSGANGHLKKPFEAPTVLAAVSDAFLGL